MTKQTDSQTDPVSLAKVTYFMTKLHQMAQPLVQLCVDRLVDSGWSRTADTGVNMQSYSDVATGTTTVLSKTVLFTFGEQSQPCYSVNDLNVGLSKYLEAETLLSASGCVYNGSATIAETKWRKQGTAEQISMQKLESGVYLTAVASQETHLMLSEYCVPTDSPGILWSAVDSDNVLWEIEIDEQNSSSER